MELFTKIIIFQTYMTFFDLWNTNKMYFEKYLLVFHRRRSYRFGTASK